MALIGLDAVPTLWRFVVAMEARVLEKTQWFHHRMSQDWDRSAIFMICCYFIYLLVNLPTYFYRTIVLKKGIIRDFYLRRRHNWLLDDIARGRPVNAVLLFTAICALEFKLLGLKFDSDYLLGVGLYQLTFLAVYPLMIQPIRKTLTIMEPGELKDAIEELSVAAKFPLKEAYIIDDQHTSCVQVFGLPKRKYIGIPQYMMEENDKDDLTGFVAHELGSWKHANGLRVFCVGQVFFAVVWSYLVIFMGERTNYEAFGFHEEYPRMAAFVIFTLTLAPPLAVFFGICMNYMSRQNSFLAGV